MKDINEEAQIISSKLKIDDSQKVMGKSFPHIKDHKVNFISKASCRLQNPSKTELKQDNFTKYGQNIMYYVK